MKHVEFNNRINLDNWCVWLVIKKKSITMHGNMNVKCYRRSVKHFGSTPSFQKPYKYVVLQTLPDTVTQHYYTLMGTSSELTSNVRFNRFVSPSSESKTHTQTCIHTHTHTKARTSYNPVVTYGRL